MVDAGIVLDSMWQDLLGIVLLLVIGVMVYLKVKKKTLGEFWGELRGIISG